MDGIIEESSNKLRRNLESWREIVVEVESLLLWKRPTDPGIIIGITTFISIIFWYLDLSTLTNLSILGLSLVLADFIVPKASAHFFPASYWNGKKQKKYEEICRTLARKHNCLRTVISHYWQMRNTKPTIFFGATIGCLLFLTWIGNSVNNILLTYMMVNIMAMLPGLNNRGLLAPIKNVLSLTCCSGGKENVKVD